MAECLCARTCTFRLLCFCGDRDGAASNDLDVAPTDVLACATAGELVGGVGSTATFLMRRGLSVIVVNASCRPSLRAEAGPGLGLPRSLARSTACSITGAIGCLVWSGVEFVISASGSRKLDASLTTLRICAAVGDLDSVLCCSSNSALLRGEVSNGSICLLHLHHGGVVLRPARAVMFLQAEEGILH